MPKTYDVMVIDDHLTRRDVERAFEADAGWDGSDGTLRLWRDAIITSKDEALAVLEELGRDLPPAILLDDYLDTDRRKQPAALEIMSFLQGRCLEFKTPRKQWPRVTLCSGGIEPQLAYTFTVLGGMQVVDKRQFDTAGEIPTAAIWRSLHGIVWQPEMEPPDLKEEVTAAVPWLDAGYTRNEIVAMHGITSNQIEVLIDHIDRFAEPKIEGKPNMAKRLAKAKANGLLWVPLEWYRRYVPEGRRLPLPLVIDWMAQREVLGLPEPLPRGLPADCDPV